MRGIKKIIAGVFILGCLIYALMVFDTFREVPNDSSQTNNSGNSTTTNSVEDRIFVASPASGDIISSPVTVTGQARGMWYFEASFPIKIIDQNGNELGVGYAQAEGDWMTENFVPFKGEIEFNTGTSTMTSGYIRFQRDNPSGLPEHDAYIDLPVLLR